MQNKVLEVRRHNGQNPHGAWLIEADSERCGIPAWVWDYAKDGIAENKTGGSRGKKIEKGGSIWLYRYI